ncbi:MAG TPA: glycosyltransferase [bacterium]|nr:glycosyltransferase [bacterium]
MKSIAAKAWFLLRLLVFSLAALAYAAWVRLLCRRRCALKGTAESRTAIVFISTHPFTGLWQRPQQIAVRLAKSYPILYFWPRYASDLARRKENSQQVEPESASSIRLVSPLLLPFGRAIPAVYKANLGTARSAIAHRLRAMGFSAAPTLWFYAPRFAHLLDSLEHSAVVYDIMDEHSAFSFARRDMKELETRLLRDADVVFAGTNTLAERKRELAPEIKYLPCGVEFEHFSAAAAQKLPVPAAFSSVNGPLIGYFGAVDDRLDFDMLLAAAMRHPDWTILLVGPRFGTKSQNELVQSQPNIVMPGLVPYAELPAYLAQFDVAVLPFVLNELTMHIHPTKVLEYLASRTPVVSTPIPDVVKFYSGVVKIASTPHEFIAAVENLLSRPDADAVERGYQMARASSWDALVERMMADLKRALLGRSKSSGRSPATNGHA